MHDSETNTAVARKTMLFGSARSAVELKREFRALASASHVNLVSLFELEAHERNVSFTMELVDGTDIVTYGRSHPEEMRSLLAQALAGCHAMHAHGWLHRDLKPRNILVERGRVVILDFGLVGVLGGPGSGAFYGTPAYASPEQLMSAEVDGKSDVFSLGVIAFEILFGAPPDWQLDWRVPPPPDGVVDDSDLADLVMSMLRVEAGARPSALELLERLLGHADGVPQSMGFVGREAELKRGLPSSGAFRLVVVEGESGIGKSRFLSELLARHVAGGGLAFRAECRLWENVAYRAIDPIVDALSVHFDKAGSPAALTDLERAALSEAFATLDLGEAGAEAPAVRRREAVASGLAKLLAAASCDVRLAVAIDDLQWADGDSIALLREVMRVGTLPNVDLILVSRSDDRTVLDDLLESVNPDERIQLGPLSLEESAELIRSSGGPASLDVGSMHAMAGGSPFYLSEAVRLLRAHSERPEAGRIPSIPERKMDLLEPSARRLVEWVCVSDSPVGTKLAAALSDGGRSAYYDLMRLQKECWLRSVSTRDGVEYEAYHSKLREHVLASLGETRAALHDRFAVVLGRLHPNRLESLTFHLHEAGRDPEAAVYAMRSGTEAQRRLAFASARSFFDKAIAWGNFDSERASELALRRAQVLYNLGDCASAAAAAEAAPPGAYLSRNDRAVFVASAWFSAGYLDSGLRTLGTLMGDRALERPGRGRLQLKLAAQLVRLRLTAMRDFRPRAEAERWRAEMYGSLGKISMMSTKHGAVFQIQALIEWLKIGDERGAAPGLAFLSNVCAHLGLFPSFGAACMARAREIGSRLRDAYVLGTCDLWGSLMALIREDWHLAAHMAERGVEAMEGQHYGMTWECVTSRNFLLMSLEKLGQIDRLLALARQFVELAESRNDSYSRTIFSLFELYWSMGTRPGAETRKRVAALRELWGSGMFTVQDFYMLRVEVYSHLMEGETEAAWELLEQCWGAVRESDAPDLPNSALDAHLLRGIAALHMVRIHGANRAFARIVRKEIRALRSNALGEAHGYADLVQGMLAALRSDSGSALASVRRAQECFDRLGASVGARYAAEMSRALGVGPEGGQSGQIPLDRFLTPGWLQTMIPLRPTA